MTAGTPRAGRRPKHTLRSIRQLHVLHRLHPRPNRVQAVDARFRERVEVRHVRGLQVEVAVRIELDPTVEGRPLQGDEFFEQPIHRDLLPS